MGEVLYRMRSATKLLEYGELEKLQIYLADHRELNDPMEGHKNVLIQGDAVLWENLLRHFLLNLSFLMLLARLDKEFSEPAIRPFLTSSDLPTDDFRGQYGEMCDAFLGLRAPRELLARLSAPGAGLRREEAAFVLNAITGDGFLTVLEVWRRHGLIPDGEPIPRTDETANLLAAFFDEGRSPTQSHLMALASNAARREAALGAAFSEDDTGRRTDYFQRRFSDRYLDAIIGELVHPGWRAACFSRTCTNPSNWATYAESHKGVALVFRPQLDGDKQYLPLTGVVGSSAVKGKGSTVVRGPVKGFLKPVTYTNSLPPIDFFKSLGAIPRGKLETAWLATPDGRKSTYVTELNAETDAWRNAYWEDFDRVTLCKLEEWKHEEEVRIVMADSLGLRTDPKNALVEFDFSCLEGIVFGLRTPEDQKLEMLRQLKHHTDRTGHGVNVHHMTFSAELGGKLIRV